MMPGTRNHSYLRTHEISGAILKFELAAEEHRLREQAAAARSGRSGKTLVKEGRLRITDVALKKGTVLRPPQQAEGAISMLVRRGRLRVTADSGAVEIGPGDLVVFDEEVAHSAQALSDCVVLITAAMSQDAAIVR
jgi:quercetin dioxygenase-like cupin family protein